MIQIRGLEKSIIQGQIRTPILRGIDLDIPVGSFSVLLGPSGCGKTTLLHVLGAIESFDRGDVRVSGLQLSGATREQIATLRRNRVGFIFQNYNLIPTLSARENVELALDNLRVRSSERVARASNALDMVGLNDVQTRFPAQLSGGQQQRVAIARALVKEPELLLADEPTGSLDRTNSRLVIELMHRLRRERQLTILLATHDLEIARSASPVAKMEDGRIVHCASAVTGETVG